MNNAEQIWHDQLHKMAEQARTVKAKREQRAALEATNSARRMRDIERIQEERQLARELEWL